MILVCLKNPNLTTIIDAFENMEVDHLIVKTTTNPMGYDKDDEFPLIKHFNVDKINMSTWIEGRFAANNGCGSWLDFVDIVKKHIGYEPKIRDHTAVDDMSIVDPITKNRAYFTRNKETLGSATRLGDSRLRVKNKKRQTKLILSKVDEYMDEGVYQWFAFERPFEKKANKFVANSGELTLGKFVKLCPELCKSQFLEMYKDVDLETLERDVIVNLREVTVSELMKEMV